MSARYILALDQGTTSSRSILFDHDGNVVSVAQREFTQHFPKPGWVEHDAVEIWETQLATAREVLAQAGISASDIAAIGITNQRETAVLWDRATGEPLHRAIVWQCRRTASICEKLVAAGLGEEVQQRTGLVIDAYFSGTKLQWLLDTVPGARARAERGELCFGTIDSWLLFKLTGRHATDYSNASRTMLFNIHDLAWDDFLLEQLNIPREVLPEVFPSSEVYGETTVLGDAIPVASLIGDQQAALFGQAAFSENMSKNTYGTGCFMLLNTGSTPVASRQGLLTTIAWGLDGAVDYALEGSVFVGGAVIQWLRDELGLLASAAESESVAQEVEDNGGVYLVPAFVGLGAPHWEMAARGTITGLTRGSKRAHIVRAALESISFQSSDVLHAMERETGAKISELRVDGHATANNYLLQHQSNVLGIPVVRGQVLETTALGAAFLAGLAVGYWGSRDEIVGIWQEATKFLPKWDESQRKREFIGWEGAIRGTKSSISHNNV